MSTEKRPCADIETVTQFWLGRVKVSVSWLRFRKNHPASSCEPFAGNTAESVVEIRDAGVATGGGQQQCGETRQRLEDKPNEFSRSSKR